ncbi:hypothetical protein QJS10_CPA01g00572 [Acorus calamus]|uniref:Glycine-rich protein n=1 Tax=Acorus calamus TaxID=4465 RepID=A0AAV9FMC6_ACOCL|nr:hypothetical protein QJS10_CPA01g00572 [Acorus calamus]
MSSKAILVLLVLLSSSLLFSSKSAARELTETSVPDHAKKNRHTIEGVYGDDYNPNPTGPLPTPYPTTPPGYGGGYPGHG